MKKQILFLCFLTIIFACTATAGAAPVEYIFSGNVIELAVDDTSLDTGISVGDDVSYTLLIDFDRLGTMSTWDGTQYVVQELDAATFGLDTFYAQYSDGFLIDNSLITTTPKPDLSNYGYSFLGVTIYIGSQDHILVLNTMDGTNWSATEQAPDANVPPGAISVTSGGTLSAVPIPGSILLLFSGLIGIVGIRKH